MPLLHSWCDVLLMLYIVPTEQIQPPPNPPYRSKWSPWQSVINRRGSYFQLPSDQYFEAPGQTIMKTEESRNSLTQHSFRNQQYNMIPTAELPPSPLIQKRPSTDEEKTLYTDNVVKYVKVMTTIQPHWRESEDFQRLMKSVKQILSQQPKSASADKYVRNKNWQVDQINSNRAIPPRYNNEQMLRMSKNKNNQHWSTSSYMKEAQRRKDLYSKRASGYIPLKPQPSPNIRSPQYSPLLLSHWRNKPLLDTSKFQPLTPQFSSPSSTVQRQHNTSKTKEKKNKKKSKEDTAKTNKDLHVFLYGEKPAEESAVDLLLSIYQSGQTLMEQYSGGTTTEPGILTRLANHAATLSADVRDIENLKNSLKYLVGSW